MVPTTTIGAAPFASIVGVGSLGLDLEAVAAEESPGEHLAEGGRGLLEGRDLVGDLLGLDGGGVVEAVDRVDGLEAVVGVAAARLARAVGVGEQQHRGAVAVERLLQTLVEGRPVGLAVERQHQSVERVADLEVALLAGGQRLLLDVVEQAGDGGERVGHRVAEEAVAVVEAVLHVGAQRPLEAGAPG